jgi:hypothetical protein
MTIWSVPDQNVAAGRIRSGPNHQKIGRVRLANGSLSFFSEMLCERKQTEAEILAVEVEAFQNQDEGQTFTTYRANYRVRWQAGGRAFQIPLLGDLVSASAGTAGVAYINPNDPSQVRLDLRKNVNAVALPLWLLVAGASLLLLGLSLWLMGTPTAIL